MGKGFKEKVFAIVSQIPKGRVTTYGEIARMVNWQSPASRITARQVGQMLHQNKDPQNIPCHRVVFKDGSLAPGYVFGGPAAQRQKLESEGVRFKENGKVNWI